ncbi:hypothetical protein E4U38_001839 [Claviceps purpurea]|nr:hypothetical protein E4U12_006564 [Claviceps purpurea]KAG6135482.1 hypothetical protein E4U38_001839 [Claviceps purpurea]KAG6164404.1 hypothetical protein E4U11_001264 [Claviceps purpurea]KAG6309425.1 hypothetical protein E4U44_006946 [Claviceps purpurea]
MRFFTKKQSSDEDVESTADGRETDMVKPSTEFNLGHFLYLLCRDAIPGMVVSAAVNMAISYVMYVVANDGPTVCLFRLPKSLAGDAAMTIFVHCIITWFLKFNLVRNDLRNGIAQPIAFADDELLNEDVCWLMFLSPETGEAVESVRMDSLKWIARHLVRALVFASMVFLTFWPISLIPLILSGDRDETDFTYRRMWAPQIFKTTLGGLLGLLTSPIISMIWLLRAGREANVED